MSLKDARFLSLRRTASGIGTLVTHSLSIFSNAYSAPDASSLANIQVPIEIGIAPACQTDEKLVGGSPAGLGIPFSKAR
jgi:hypothetical protein